MRNTFLFAIVSIYCLSSCSNLTPKYLLAPNSPNLLQIEKRNDFKASASYATTEHDKVTSSNAKQISNGLDVQTAYGLSNKFAIKLDAYAKWEIDKDNSRLDAIDNYNIAYKRKSVDVSVGYYKGFGEKKDFVFNVFTGVGFGSDKFSGLYRNDSLIVRTYNANHVKWFLMPSATIDVFKNYSITLAYKFSVLHFNYIHTNDNELKTGFYKELTQKNSLFGDFAIENQFGFNSIKGIKFHASFGFTKLYTNFVDKNASPTGINSNISGQYFYNNRFASIGVIANVNELFTKK
jgi:hypothetical protein